MATATADPVWRAHPGSQALFLSCPVFEVLYEGTRGPGKTDGLLMDFAQFCGQGFGANWRGILFRRTYKQLSDVIAKSKRWFYQLYPGIRYNESEHTWTWPTGEQLLLRYMDNPNDYWNYHGHEYPWIGWEELTNWATLECYHSMKSCCRSSFPGMPRHYRATANPWGVGHNVVKAYFIDPAPAGVVVLDEHGKPRVRITGHWSENAALLRADPNYPTTIAAAASSEAQRRAWLMGDWDIVAGGMFDDVWDASTHVILEPFDIPASWRIDRAFDWGASKPFSVGWWAESDGTRAPNGVHYPIGTLFRIAEWYGWNGTPNTGIHMGEVAIARGIVERETSLEIRARCRPGPADSSIFDTEPGRTSIGDVMKQNGADFTLADKRPGSRKQGWTAIRRRLEAAKNGDKEQPHLYVFAGCRQFIRTVPTLPRSEKDPDDVDTEAEDHVGDETRYRVRAPKPSRIVQYTAGV